MMPDKTWYVVLNDDTVDEISRMSGLTTKELEEQRRQANLFGYKDVYWTEGNQWWRIRLARETIDGYGLPLLMAKARGY